MRFRERRFRKNSLSTFASIDRRGTKDDVVKPEVAASYVLQKIKTKFHRLYAVSAAAVQLEELIDVDRLKDGLMTAFVYFRCQ